MMHTSTTTFSTLVAILAIHLFILPRPSFANTVAYCSTENTSDGDAQFSIYQSHGFCNDACKGSHPFGVILGKNCWCSDYIPADQVDTSQCNDDCSGYPDETCGNLAKNLYIYVRLDSTAQVKGTKGTSEPTSSSVSPSSSANPVASSPADAASSSEVKTSKPPVAAPIIKSTAAAPSSSPTPIDTSGDNPSDTPQITSVQVITVSGVIVTHTVVTSPSSVAAETGPQPKKTNGGAIAGGVVGGFAVLGAIVGAVIFTLWRRRQQQRDAEDQSGVHRNTSTMSKHGLMRGENGLQYPPKIATTFNTRTTDNISISPISGSDRRGSRLVFDQRLNPNAIMVLDNPSRESFASMDDSRDYGRTLNVRNPDPESRSVR